MATIQRNVKTFGNRSFVAEVSAAPSNYAPILANEVDADLDTVYAAWNGGADTVNIKDGSVTTLKLADAPNGITTAKLNDLSVTTAKLAAGSTFPLRNSMVDAAALTAGNNTWLFVGELLTTVDITRPMILMLRLYCDVSRLTTSGALGQSFTARTYYGGTAGTLDGTAMSAEEMANVAMTSVNDYQTIWYPFFTTFAPPPANPFRWKAFINNPNNTLYQLRKRYIAMQLWQFA
jgi:hypothetical protein